MPVDAPLIRRRAVFGAKAEATTGTAESLTTAEAAFNAWNVSIKPDIALTRREGQGSSLDTLPGVPGARGARINVETEIYGAATVPAWGLLLQASGFGLSSRTYTITSSAINDTTLTVGNWIAGRFYSAVGVVLNWAFSMRSGQVVRSTWTGTGAWVPPTSTALIAPTYPTTLPPRAASATFTIGGQSYKISSLDFDLGNQIVYREDVTKLSGYFSAAITDRAPTVRIDPEALLLSTKDWHADHLASTEAALSLVINGGANNTFTLSMPKLQLVEAPDDGERGGIFTDMLTFAPNRSAAAGDDSIVGVFS